MTVSPDKKAIERLRRLKEKVAEIRSRPRSDGRLVVRPRYSPEVLQALAELRIDDVEDGEDPEDGGTLVP